MIDSIKPEEDYISFSQQKTLNKSFIDSLPTILCENNTSNILSPLVGENHFYKK